MSDPLFRLDPQVMGEFVLGPIIFFIWGGSLSAVCFLLLAYAAPASPLVLADTWQSALVAGGSTLTGVYAVVLASSLAWNQGKRRLMRL